ncbi:uncharacterized protein SCHCODRAFT_02614063 [Schizophyllum commune H4-8]|nr:uncharacterized protein SCHCODRAFT_02614063 [Schizophyllum commune H4-8]KAI5896109.1 hypothetical protein SCHCODRAFT_02614063 [Schizophyllum commune H4-8]
MAAATLTRDSFHMFPNQETPSSSPVLSAEAHADLQRYGEKSARLLEWSRVWLEPAMPRIRALWENFNAADPRLHEIVAFSNELSDFKWIIDSRCMPEAVQKQLDERAESAVREVNAYWNAYYDYMEECEPRAIDLSDPSVVSAVKAWFKQMRICFDSMLAMFGASAFVEMQRRLGFAEGWFDLDGERYWRIILTGLVRYLQNGEKSEWPSTAAQTIDGGSVRYQLSIDFVTLVMPPERYRIDLDCVMDPVTLGGVVGSETYEAYYDKKLSEQERTQIFAQNLTIAIYHAIRCDGVEDSRSRDMMGVQAVSTFLDFWSLLPKAGKNV